MFRTLVGEDGSIHGVTVPLAMANSLLSPGNPPGALDVFTPSPDNSTIPPFTRLIDYDGAVWTIEAGTNHVLRDGVWMASGIAQEMLWYGGYIYHLGTTNDWFQWTPQGTWLNVGPTQPGTSPGGLGPSGIPMPVGDVISGGLTWRQIFADDFSTYSVPLGTWQSPYADSRYPQGGNVANWNAYPYPWPGSPNPDGRAHYWPERGLSINDYMPHCLDWYHFTDSATGYHVINAPFPRLDAYRPFTALRTATCVYSENFPGYHPSFLLWPDSNNFPYDGEIDFPEGAWNGVIEGYMHWQNCPTGQTQQDAVRTTTPFYNRWNVCVVEWRAGVSAKFFLNGTPVYSGTAHIPNTPMHPIVQTNVTSPNSTSTGHAHIDWWCAWVAS